MTRSVLSPRRNHVQARFWYSRKRIAASLLVIPLLEARCSLPILIFPAPEAASGMQIRFVDEHGQRIKKDGLLLVDRDHWLPLGSRPIEGKRTAHLVEIADGIAKMPDEWVVAMFCLVWWPPFPPLFGIYPGKNVRIEPFLPGYYCDTLVEYDDFKWGIMRMMRSENREGYANNYWSVQLTGLNNKPTQPPLGISDHEKLERFIELELARLRVSPNEKRVETFV